MKKVYRYTFLLFVLLFSLNFSKAQNLSDLIQYFDITDQRLLNGPVRLSSDAQALLQQVHAFEQAASLHPYKSFSFEDPSCIKGGQYKLQDFYLAPGQELELTTDLILLVEGDVILDGNIYGALQQEAGQDGQHLMIKAGGKVIIRGQIQLSDGADAFMETQPYALSTSKNPYRLAMLSSNLLAFKPNMPANPNQLDGGLGGSLVIKADAGIQIDQEIHLGKGGVCQAGGKNGNGGSITLLSNAIAQKRDLKAGDGASGPGPGGHGGDAQALWTSSTRHYSLQTKGAMMGGNGGNAFSKPTFWLPPGVDGADASGVGVQTGGSGSRGNPGGNGGNATSTDNNAFGGRGGGGSSGSGNSNGGDGGNGGDGFGGDGLDGYRGGGGVGGLGGDSERFNPGKGGNGGNGFGGNAIAGGGNGGRGTGGEGGLSGEHLDIGFFGRGGNGGVGRGGDGGNGSGGAGTGGNGRVGGDGGDGFGGTSSNGPGGVGRGGKGGNSFNGGFEGDGGNAFGGDGALGFAGGDAFGGDAGLGRSTVFGRGGDATAGCGTPPGVATLGMGTPDGEDLTSCLPVPVSWLSFEAKMTPENQVQLLWETASEQNNQGFDVQRSTNGNDWTSIGFIKGIGTNNRQQLYQYLDQPERAGTYYYRLKQIDFDGSTDYSIISSVTFQLAAKQSDLLLYPNPVEGDWLSVESPALPEAGIDLEIIDQLGRVRLRWQIKQSPTQLDLSSLSAGIYYLNVRFDGQWIRKKIVLN